MKRLLLSLLLSFGLTSATALVTAAPALADDHPVICNDGTVQYYFTGPSGSTSPAQVCAGIHKGPAKDQTGVDAKAAAALDAVTAAAAAKGPCSANQVEIAVVFPGQTHCVDNSQPGGAIVAYLKVLLAYLSTLIGAVIVLMIVIGGIQYIVSAGDPAQIKNAKTRIINAFIALFLFLAAFAILSFIVPGGIFK